MDNRLWDLMEKLVQRAALHYTKKKIKKLRSR